MINYKVTNKLEASIRIGEIIFNSKETKILDFKPKSDIFIIEKIEKKGESVPVVPKKNKINRRTKK